MANNVAVAENADPNRTGEAIRRVVDLTGGMDWLKPGQTVVVKPALNSAGQFPFTASPIACAELVRMCIERGAAKVFVADRGGEMAQDRTMLGVYVEREVHRRFKQKCEANGVSSVRKLVVVR